jgi:hypothetical protein
MLWDIMLGSIAAIFLIVILSLVVTGLTNFYQKLIQQGLQTRRHRPELIPVYARFAAVLTIVLILVLVLSVRMEIAG